MLGLDDEASVGAIPYAILTIIVFALVYLALGVAVDEVVKADNNLISSGGIPYSDQRLDAFGVALMGFHVMPFVAVFAILIFLIQNGMQRQDTTVKPLLLPLIVSTVGMVVCILFIMGIGPIIDTLITVTGSLDFSAWGRELVQEPLVFADWTYVLIKIMVVAFALYPFIFLFRRHEYQDLDPYMR